MSRVPLAAPAHVDEAARSREDRRRAAGMLSDIVDAHTHLFPDPIYRALERWFDKHAWSIRFRAGADEVVQELARAGASRVVALVYAHKPGMAEALNGYLSQLCKRTPAVIGVGTVLPGEPDARRVVRDAITVHRLRGIKLHCHVMGMAIDDPRVLEVLAECEQLRVPAVVHCGRAPAAEGYPVATATICSAARTERVLRALPQLRLVVPHVGMDETDQYLALLDAHEHLHLDTAMACAEYFDAPIEWAAIERHADRILFGSDFPIVPYESGRELGVLARRIVSDAAFRRITRDNARAFWAID